MKTLLILIAVIAETLSIYGQATGIWSNWTWYWLLHGLAAGTYTCACLMLLPEEYKRPIAQSVLFITVIAFGIPVAGMIGLTMLYVVLVNWPKKSNPIIWRRADHIELPADTQDISTSMFGAGALKDILLYHPDPERRLDAVKACRYIPSREAIPLFRLAVTDKEDDIRLFAFSCIDNIDNTLTEKIGNLRLKLEKSESTSMLIQIGELYWEFYYLGLSDGAITKTYLDFALLYFEKAASKEPRGQVYIKLGRVHLAQNNLHEAEKCFQRAIELGILEEKVSLYLAEIAFRRKEYFKVAQLLRVIDENLDGEHSEEIQEYWCEPSK